MTTKRKELETELIVTDVRSQDDTVTLDLRFTKPRFEKPSKQQLENVIQPMASSQMERMGSDMARGYMSVVQKQIQQQMRQLEQIIPPTPPPDVIRITLSKQEYVELGRPTVDDKLALKLQMKAT